jgi:hypothetical protein
MHSIADDGFLRMTLEDVLSLPFTHLASGVDEISDDGVERCGSCTTISGYTEWVARTSPPVSVGWDWIVDAGRWMRAGPPRSNVLLVDPIARPYDWARNEAILGTVVDAIPWQEQAREAVCRRCA